MKQKELLEKLEGEPKDSGDQIRLIKKFFSYMTGKNIRKLGGKMKFYYLKIILFLFVFETILTAFCTCFTL